MIALYAATDNFQAEQRAAAERIARESGAHIDALIDHSARHQGFQSAELFERQGRWFLRTWYAFKNLSPTEAIRAARAWYEQSPSKHTVYVSDASADEAYGLAVSLGARRSQAVA